MTAPPLLHLVARTAARARPFQHRAACAELWRRIARSFDLVACVLMPDHVHVLAQIEQDVALRTFARVLSAFRLRMQAGGQAEFDFDWESLPQPEKVQHDRRHIARTLRYIHLNPTRDALCDDPLEWEWSTHRDWVGAVARPVVDRTRWARTMGRRLPSCVEWLHEYVSADVSIARPRPVSDHLPYLQAEKDASIDAIASAVPRVLRSACNAPQDFGAIERRLFLLAAARWTRYRAPELARLVGCHRTSAWKMIRCEEHAGLQRRADRNDRSPPDLDKKQSVDSKPARRASANTSRIRRTPLSDIEARAIALTLADARLSSMPLSLAGGLPTRRPSYPASALAFR
ncbi:MAG: transposase [Burkholderiaceae bacterium]|nr:transposase [Burkholderiaceae bacterium]